MSTRLDSDTLVFINGGVSVKELDGSQVIFDDFVGDTHFVHPPFTAIIKRIAAQPATVQQAVAAIGPESPRGEAETESAATDFILRAVDAGILGLERG